VCDPVKKEGIKSYVMYTINIRGSTENIFRRYSDFFALRAKLTERWPGVFIPNIPPKKAVVRIFITILGESGHEIN
jgi:sorting nexin-1/2